MRVCACELLNNAKPLRTKITVDLIASHKINCKCVSCLNCRTNCSLTLHSPNSHRNTRDSSNSKTSDFCLRMVSQRNNKHQCVTLCYATGRLFVRRASCLVNVRLASVVVEFASTCFSCHDETLLAVTCRAIETVTRRQRNARSICYLL